MFRIGRRNTHTDCPLEEPGAIVLVSALRFGTGDNTARTHVTLRTETGLRVGYMEGEGAFGTPLAEREVQAWKNLIEGFSSGQGCFSSFTARFRLCCLDPRVLPIVDPAGRQNDRIYTGRDFSDKNPDDTTQQGKTRLLK